MSNPFEELHTELQEIKELLTRPPLQSPGPEIINRQELLKRLGITEPTAIRQGRQGLLPELRIGNNVRYNWPDVVQALKDQEEAKKTHKRR